MKVWLLAARPKTLLAGLCPVILGASIAYQMGVLSWEVLGLSCISVLLLQVGTNFANDYSDALNGKDTTQRLGPQRATQSGLISVSQMRGAMILMFVLSVLAALPLMLRGGGVIVGIGVVSILCAYLYTGGPYPLAYHGLGDIVAWVFFGPVAVMGTLYLHAFTWPLFGLYWGALMGLFSVALLAVNNTRDFREDTQTGKRTLVVRFGERFGRIEYALALFIASFVPAGQMIMTGDYAWALLTVGVLLLKALIIRSFLMRKGSELNYFLGETARLMLLYTVVMASYICWG